MGAVDALIDLWRMFDVHASPYVHPIDKIALNGTKDFDLEAIPYPYVGDIQSADVWVLMLNSNIGPDDKTQESEDYFSKRLQENLRQTLDGHEYKMLSLDPRLSHTGTYAYYNRRNGLAKLVDRLAGRRNVPEREARKELANRIAVIQLFPYRSTSGVPARFLSDAIPSVQLARKAVHEAMKGKLIVVPRSASRWGFAYGVRSENLFTFRGDQARSASLMPGGVCGGGDAILERLCAGDPPAVLPSGQADG